MTVLLIPTTDRSKDADKYLTMLLNSIEVHELYKKYEVVVLWDSCQDKFIDYFCNRYEFINYQERFINRGNPFKFSKNVNVGLKYVYESTDQDCIVVNQDAILPSYDYLKHLTGQGLCSPDQYVFPEESFDDSLIREVLAAAQPVEVVRTDHIKITGFCLYVSRNILEKVGYIDTYFPAGYDDNDYCIRTKLAGLPVEKVNILVQHFVSKLGSYNTLQSHQLVLQLQKYHIKWSIPMSINDDGSLEKWILDNHNWEPSMCVR